jgi:hypothetical protein
MIKRIFRGEILTNFATALVSILTLQLRLSDQISTINYQRKNKFYQKYPWLLLLKADSLDYFFLPFNLVFLSPA